jgi:Tfp pilus assembly protein PilF
VRKHRRVAIMLLSRCAGAGWLIAVSLLTPDSRAATAAPYRPSDDAQPLERLPGAGSKTTRELRRLHAELARSPNNLELAIGVAKRDIAVARREGDSRYDGYAEAALAPWLSLSEPPTEVVVLRATLRQTKHDFSGALADLSRAVSADPRNAQGWLTRAVILQVEGDYTKALGNCLNLARIAEPLVSAICIDSVSGLSGKAAASYADLQQILDRAPFAEDPEIRLWALTVLAETAARLGNTDAAEQQFNAAMRLGIRDVYLLGAYADFLLDQDRPRDVQLLLENEARIDPLLLRLALAEQSLGAPGLTAHIAELKERFYEARLRGDNVHRREEARFTLCLLKQPREALELAAANWSVQREPADTRLLIEAAVAANAPSAATAALDWLAASRLEDRQIREIADRLQATSR